MDALEIRIAYILAERASRPKGVRITYPMLAGEIGWYNATGQGLGRPLSGVLQFCRQNNLPILTSIVCATGSKLPSTRGIEAMRQELTREINVAAEQEAVFAYDWSRVADIGLPIPEREIDFRKLVAVASQIFSPELCSILFAPALTSGFMEGENGYSPFVLLYSNAEMHAKKFGGGGRLLGIAELAPSELLTPSAIEPGFSAHMNFGLGQVKGPLIKKAWRFERSPLTQSALPNIYKSNITDAVQPLTAQEIAEVAQHSLQRVYVYGSADLVPTYQPPAPALHTYMVVCNCAESLKGTKAEKGSLLVKIGVSNDRERRLMELNGNHIGVVFGVRFDEYSHGSWSSQNEALEVERLAHEWCHKHGQHASGEYFFLNEDQRLRAGMIVKKGFH